MIFIDSCVPMFLVGASHHHQVLAQRAVARLVGAGERLVTDVAVLEEILHRYTVIHRRDALRPAYEALLSIADEVLPIDIAAAERARDIALDWRRLPARAALHVAVMQHHGIARVLSFDRAFDRLPGIARLSA
jgi:predicted nucleic acid-binding protein